MPRTKLVRTSGGDGGGKAADRREGERRRMPRAQNRNRHVTEAVNLRIGGVQNRDHVRPSIGARCGKAARRDLCGGAGVTRFPTATVEPRPPCRCAYFGLPGWVTDQGAVAALSGGAARCEKKRFSVSPKSNAAEASTRIRPLVIVGLVAGCADEAL